jgi:hypothetical protein
MTCDDCVQCKVGRLSEALSRMKGQTTIDDWNEATSDAGGLSYGSD